MKKNRSRKKMRIILGIIACMLVAAIGYCIVIVARGNFGGNDRICEGVKIGLVDVGNMSEAQAEEKVEKFIEQQCQRDVVIHVSDHDIAATAAAIGLSYSAEGLVEKAVAIGKEGNIWKRFQENRQAERGKKNIELPCVISEEKAQEYIQEYCSVYDIKAKNSKLKMVNGKLRATKERTGLCVQVPETVSQMKKALEKSQKDEKNLEGTIEITADVEVTQPEITKEEASKCTDLLGSYTTTYSTYQAERSANLATATGRINGTVLEPGEVFSVVKTIKDRTLENGYKAAPEYSSGKVVEGIGGGVCQVSTTLYNAVLNAELKIVQRSPHSMMVSYVPVSRDAAISGDYKDMKFKNNTDYPVYIMGSAAGGVLGFKIYGYDNREENRKISFESEIIDTIEPGAEVVTEDPNLPASYRSVTQSAHIGYKAKLWKIVTVDGVQQEKILVNTSTYNASPQYVTVGKQQPTPSPEASQTPEEDSDKNATNTKKPASATKLPKASVAPEGSKPSSHSKKQ